MENISINNMIITSIETIHAYSRITGTLELYLDQLDNVTISNSEDETDITGKKGNILKKLKQNKAVEVTGESATWSGALLSAQVGSEAVSNENTIVRRVDLLTVNNNAATTKFAPVGTTGNEIGTVFVRSANGDVVSQQSYTQSTQSNTTSGNKPVFYTSSSDNGTYTINFPTTGDYSLDDGTVIVVTYDYKVNASTISNYSDKFGKTLDVWIDLLVTDTCDRTYKASVHMPRGQFSGNFDIAVTGDQVMQDFTINNLVDTCNTTSTNKLWDFIVFSDEESNVA